MPENSRAFGKNGRRYEDTCTRLNVNAPLSLAKMEEPTICKLRKLANAKHFVDSERGRLIAYPADYRSRVTKNNIANDPENKFVEKSDAEKLRDILESHGVAVTNWNDTYLNLG